MKCKILYDTGFISIKTFSDFDDFIVWFTMYRYITKNAIMNNLIVNVIAKLQLYENDKLIYNAVFNYNDYK